MVISYSKLWRILEQRRITKKELVKRAGMSETTIRNMSRGENVSLTMLAKICDALHVNLGDIAEFVDV
jgi:DNA-binding Xre family transcriptional regulator